MFKRDLFLIYILEIYLKKLYLTLKMQSYNSLVQARPRCSSLREGEFILQLRPWHIFFMLPCPLFDSVQ